SPGGFWPDQARSAASRAEPTPVGEHARRRDRAGIAKKHLVVAAQLPAEIQHTEQLVHAVVKAVQPDGYGRLPNSADEVVALSDRSDTRRSAVERHERHRRDLNQYRAIEFVLGGIS